MPAASTEICGERPRGVFSSRSRRNASQNPTGGRCRGRGIPASEHKTTPLSPLFYNRHLQSIRHGAFPISRAGKRGLRKARSAGYNGFRNKKDIRIAQMAVYCRWVRRAKLRPQWPHTILLNSCCFFIENHLGDPFRGRYCTGRRGPCIQVRQISANRRALGLTQKEEHRHAGARQGNSDWKTR